MKKLNLGCGSNYLEGWVNVDISRNVKADFYADMNKPLPFKDDSFDFVLMDGVLGDADDINKVVEEVWRVLKDGGVFKFRDVFGENIHYLGYLFHKRSMIPKTFDIFVVDKKANKKWGHYIQRIPCALALGMPDLLYFLKL